MKFRDYCDNNIIWLVPLIMILITIVLASLIYFIFLVPMQNEMNKEKEECNQIQGCEKYGCLAELQGYSSSQRRNFLLQEQNCLLRNDGDQE